MSGTGDVEEGGIESDTLQTGVAVIYPADVWPLVIDSRGMINMRARRVLASGSFQLTKRGWRSWSILRNILRSHLMSINS